MLRVRVIGEMQIDVDGRAVPVPAGRPVRALLAWLALHPGVHPRGMVAGRLWPDVLDRSARESLRTALSALRRSLGGGAGALVATRELIGLEGAWVDVREVEQLSVAGRLHEAVALCRGDLLPELDTDWVIDARVEHRERHARLLSRLTDASVAAGDVGAALEFARERVAVDPLSEDAGRALLRALSGTGDRAGALVAYERLRERLSRDLGVAPSAATRALAEQLRQSAPVEVEPAALPPPLERRWPTAFVGRADELEHLRVAWSLAADGPPVVELVTGEPGMGKSRLVAEFARTVHAEGATVLFGGCDEDALAPYQPFMEALGDRLDDERWTESESRWRLFEAVAAAVRTAATAVGLVLVLDDAHWADRPTVLLLLHLVRRAQVARLLVLVSYRHTELDSTHPITATLADLRGAAVVRRVGLAGLPAREVAALIAAVTGAPPARELTTVVHEETGGNPFFVEEMARHLLETRGAAGLPEGVRDAILGRVARLGPAAAAVLTIAAVLGREFDLEVLDHLADPRDRPLLDLVDAALEAGLLGVVPGEPRRLSFAHALVRHALYGELSPLRRAHLHERAAHVIEALHSAELSDHAAEIAHHLYASSPARDLERTARYARLAGDEMMRRLAWEDAAFHYERGVQLLETPNPDRTVCELRIALGEARNRSGGTTEGRAAFQVAAREAHALGATDLLTEAALGHGGLAIVIAAPEPATLALLETALDALGSDDHADRARVCGRLAVELIYGDRPRSRVLGAEAVAAGRRAGDPRSLAYALTAAHAVLWDPDHLEERLAIADELIDIATEMNDRALHVHGLHWRAVDLFEAGDMDGFRDAVGEYSSLADLLALPAYQWYGPLWRAVDATLAGRYDEAERLGDEALVLGRRAGDANAELFREIVAYQEIEQQARFDDFVIDRVRARLAASSAPNAWRCGLAWILAETGHEDEARRELDVLADAGFSSAPRDPNWLGFIAECGETCALLGAAEYATELYDLLAPFAERNVTTGRAVAAEGSAHRVLGLLAAITGRLNAAIEHLDAATVSNTRMGLRPFVVRAQAQLVPVLRAHGEEERAAALASAVAAERARLKIGPIAEPRMSAARAGNRPRRRPPRRRTSEPSAPHS